MSPGYLAWLITKGKAQIINRDVYLLLLRWTNPKDVKRRATS
jgi:hypothetical protein